MALKINGEDFKNGEGVDYYALKGYNDFHGKMIDPSDVKYGRFLKRTGTLIYNQGGWMSKAGWILKDGSGKFQYDFNTEVNILNDKPFDNTKHNIQLLKKGPVQAPSQVVQTKPQAPTVKTYSTIDDDYFNHQKVEYLIVTHPTLYPQLSGKWVDLRFSNEENKEVIKDTYGTKKGELMHNPVSLVAKPGWWIVERGKMTHYLDDYNVLNNRFFTTNKLNIQLLPSGNNTERMQKVKAEKERKAAEAAQEAEAAQKAAETNVTPIPCSQTKIKLDDRVKYGDREGIVTGVEITYPDQTKQTVQCDDTLVSITAGIEKNKRNSGGTKRRKIKNRKTRYGKQKFYSHVI